MNSSEKDYTKLYQLQDRFLNWWCKQDIPFYLTGGTALGRFYLNHRFSEDLDFFVNADTLYSSYIEKIKRNIEEEFTVNMQQALFSEDFTRVFISDGEDQFLKVEFVNDVEFYAGTAIKTSFGSIDNPVNILANKLTAIVGRDEPKDIYDIVQIALNYSFNWAEIFNFSKMKSAINEIDVEQRLFQFPIEMLAKVDWFKEPIDINLIELAIHQIADDFLLGTVNSLGKEKAPLETARVKSVEDL